MLNCETCFAVRG